MTFPPQRNLASPRDFPETRPPRTALPEPMPDRILLPLIVACALFMENLDSTVHLDGAAGDRGGFRRQARST